MLAHARKGRDQVAEHVRRTPVVLVLVRAVRVILSGRRRGFANAVGIAKFQDVMAMYHLPRGRLPAEGRREHGREKYRDERGCDGSEKGAHEGILTQTRRMRSVRQDRIR